MPNIPAIPGMNPGVFVMGGGGGGGGGSGKGGKGNGGEQGADGENGGDGAEGGGNGAGSCGTGSPGACTNCGNNVAGGDPVDVTTGKVFTLPRRDLYLPGTFALKVLRSYSSRRAHVDLGLGHGWIHSLAWSLEVRRRGVVVWTGDGRRVELPNPEIGQEARIGAWSISRGEDYYHVRPGNDFDHFFERAESSSRRYRLQFVQYRNRGHISLQYQRGRLARVIDTVGRVVIFHGNSDGHITSIAVPDDHGQTLVFARYTYDERGNLTSATDADGHTTYFGYDNDHRMTTMEYPNGLVFHFVYDDGDRCIETWGSYPGREDPALAEGLDETLVDGTPAKGIYHCKLFFDGDYSDMYDSRRMVRTEAGPMGMAGMSVNGVGGVTTRKFDLDGRVIAKVDANGGTWAWAYDDSDNIVQEQDPEGNTVIIERDELGNEIAVVDPEGGRTELERDQHGEVIQVRDQNGAVTRFVRDARSMVTKIVDGRDGTHEFELDRHANVVAHTFPTGGTYRYSYDHWGRLTETQNPVGAVTRFSVTPGGRVAGVVDPAGRTRSYTYDGLGNLLTETLPDGSTTRWAYGGLGWLCRVTHPDGTELHARYDREGLPVYFENEKGDRHEFRHSPDGLITWERNFHGHEYSFEYDLMGRLVAFDDGTGKRTYERSPAGRLLSEEAPDGSKREYAYNARGDLVSAHADGTGFTWELDGLGRVRKETFDVASQRYAVESVLTRAGDRSAFKTSLGLEMHVRRDANGWVSELWSEGRRVLGIERDALGLPVRRTLAEGGAIVDDYDNTKLLRHRRVLGPSSQPLQSSEPERLDGGPGAIDVQYDYTPVDEVKKVTSTRGDVVYDYDVRRHLTKRQRGQEVQEFETDPAGNYHLKGFDAPGRVYGPGNQLQKHGDVALTYDERGYLIEKRLTKDGDPDIVTKFEYDGFGLLRAVVGPDGDRLEFDYDPFARRLAKRRVRNGNVEEEHHYVWDQLALLHDVERKPGGQERVQSFLFEERDRATPIGQRSDEAWHYYLLDVNGTPEAVLDGRGGVVDDLDRTPFGRTRGQAGDPATPFRFPGQFEDPETGLHYNRYRYYDPDLGRYLSPDPIGIDGGFNLYAYGPNPVGWSDPMGWQHVMTVTSNDPSFNQGGASHAHSSAPNGSSNTYQSGMQQTTPCPDNLNNRANCHTEQKFCEDLLAHNDTQGTPGQPNLGGREYNLQGQYPPCPTCHMAMRQAAARTGATINYSFNGNTISYSGTSDPQFNGAHARFLEQRGYGAPPRRSRTRLRQSSGRGSQQAYTTLMNARYR